ncbi:MAG: hypothetical protein ACYCZ1_02600 [Candidatus Humimicrobiaceae bacterium]
MPGIARQVQQKIFYHIMVQGTGSENIFESKVNKAEYIKRLKENCGS